MPELDQAALEILSVLILGAIGWCHEQVELMWGGVSKRALSTSFTPTMHMCWGLYWGVLIVKGLDSPALNSRGSKQILISAMLKSLIFYQDFAWRRNIDTWGDSMLFPVRLPSTVSC